jgi:hypothetical protein
MKHARDPKRGHRRARAVRTYTTLAGKKINNETSNYQQAEVGKPIQIVYDREDPERMQAADWGPDYLAPGIFGGHRRDLPAGRWIGPQWIPRWPTPLSTTQTLLWVT